MLGLQFIPHESISLANFMFQFIANRFIGGHSSILWSMGKNILSGRGNRIAAGIAVAPIARGVQGQNGSISSKSVSSRKLIES